MNKNEEKEIKELAKIWVQNHAPFHVINQPYGLAAFEAGYKKAMEDYGNA